MRPAAALEPRSHLPLGVQANSQELAGKVSTTTDQLGRLTLAEEATRNVHNRHHCRTDKNSSCQKKELPKIGVPDRRSTGIAKRYHLPTKTDRRQVEQNLWLVGLTIQQARCRFKGLRLNSPVHSKATEGIDQQKHRVMTWMMEKRRRRKTREGTIRQQRRVMTWTMERRRRRIQGPRHSKAPEGLDHQRH